MVRAHTDESLRCARALKWKWDRIRDRIKCTYCKDLESTILVSAYYSVTPALSQVPSIFIYSCPFSSQDFKEGMER